MFRNLGNTCYMNSGLQETALVLTLIIRIYEMDFSYNFSSIFLRKCLFIFKYSCFFIDCCYVISSQVHSSIGTLSQLRFRKQLKSLQSRCKLALFYGHWATCQSTVMPLDTWFVWSGSNQSIVGF